MSVTYYANLSEKTIVFSLQPTGGDVPDIAEIRALETLAPATWEALWKFVQPGDFLSCYEGFFIATRLKTFALIVDFPGESGVYTFQVENYAEIDSWVASALQLFWKEVIPDPAEGQIVQL